MAAVEAKGFPFIDAAAGVPHDNGTLPVTISLREFQGALVPSLSDALTRGTPFPDAARDLLQRAAAGCKTCHLYAPDPRANSDRDAAYKHVGEGVGAQCTGFEFPSTGDVYAFIVQYGEGLTAEMRIIGPEQWLFPHRELRALPTPCQVTPAVLYQNYAGALNPSGGIALNLPPVREKEL